MALLRSSSRSRSRLLSRGLVALLLVGVLVFGFYLIGPFGSDDNAVAQADETPAAEPQPTGTLKAVESTPTQEDAIPSSVVRTMTPSHKKTADDDWNLAAEEPNEPDAQVAAMDTSAAEPAAEEPYLPPTAPASGFLEEADRLSGTGDLLAARTLLNDALQSGTLDEETADAVKKRLRDVNQVIVFTPTKRYKEDPFQGEYTVQSGDLLSKIARPLDVPYQFIARINGVQPNRIRVGQTLKTIKGPIHATVSKSRFEIDLYLGGLPGTSGSMYLWSYPVGLGADSSTPTGLWEVTRGSKLENPQWTNPRTSEVYAADNPENPLGERWIGLTGIGGDALGQPSYGIHGTIEPDTIGTNASMGCVRLLDDDIEAVYEMLYEGNSLVKIID